MLNLSNGKIEIYEQGKMVISVDPDESGGRAIAAYIVDNIIPRGEVSIYCSSSCDFPEESGFAEDFDVMEFIEPFILMVYQEKISNLFKEDPELSSLDDPSILEPINEQLNILGEMSKGNYDAPKGVTSMKKLTTKSRRCDK